MPTKAKATSAPRPAPRPATVLGKLPPRPIEQCARLDRHLAVDAVALPATFSWPALAGLAWGMLLNDQLGDCTCAGVGHSVMCVTKIESGAAAAISDPEVLKLYEAVGHYVPGDESTDQGCVEEDVLAYWHAHGFVGHKIAGFGRIDHTNLAAVKTAIQTFGFVYIGTQVPAAWTLEPAVWGVPTTAAKSKIEGGHCVILIGWNKTGFRLVSWGRVFTITYAAFAKYVDEVWGVVTTDWVAKNGASPKGFNLAGLLAELAQLDGGQTQAAPKPVPSLPDPSWIGEAEGFVEGIVVRAAKKVNWRRLGAAFAGGLGAAVLAGVGAYAKHLGVAGEVEAAIGAFVVGSGLSHWTPAGSVGAEILDAIEARVIAAIESYEEQRASAIDGPHES